MTPYIDSGNTRIFPVDTNDAELVWHRDREDRTVTVMEGTDWQFQYDDCLPFNIERGDTFFIPKMNYHRLLKGSSDLKLYIVKSI